MQEGSAKAIKKMELSLGSKVEVTFDPVFQHEQIKKLMFGANKVAWSLGVPKAKPIYLKLQDMSVVLDPASRFWTETCASNTEDACCQNLSALKSLAFRTIQKYAQLKQVPNIEQGTS